jgi:DNA end-binding protein Ku
MPRPLWSGSVSFGLVNIPVKLYSAVKKQTVHFHQLRKNDGCRIRLKRICSVDGQEVSHEDIVKGYELSPDRYVIVTSTELESLYPKASRNIEISDFVNLEQINPIYFEHSYYLAPDKAASKAYFLLLAAMEQSHKVAIARLVLRNKQYLAAIRANDGILTLSTMYFANEIIQQADLEELIETGCQPEKRELDVALQLIASLSSNFEPTKYQDEYQDKVLAMIESKAAGQEIIAQQPVAKPGGKVVDLMAALEASIADLKKKQPNKDRRKKARA